MKTFSEMKNLFAVAAALMAVVSASPAKADEYKTDKAGNRYRIVSCKLIVDGNTYIAGPCELSTLNGGSFTLIKKGPNGTYFAGVVLRANGTEADLLWNKDPEARKAEELLGPLHRSSNGCWVNERATICAK